MFKTQADTEIAHTRCRRRVKGLISDMLARLRKIPIPDTTRAADEETRVRLSHLGVVSSKLCLAIALSFTGTTFDYLQASNTNS